MKLIVILFVSIFVSPSVSLARPGSNPECSYSEFCEGKIRGVIAIIENECYSAYLAYPKQQSGWEKPAKAQLNDCIRWAAEDWKSGFGRRCGGMRAQEACFLKLESYGLADVGVRVCHRY